MLVSQILASKPSHAVLSVAPDATIASAVETLSSKRIGAVVVMDSNGKLAGILSERDIVRELGKRGADVLAEPVSALMTANLVTCAEGDSADHVLQQMTDGRFRHLPVMRGGDMVGLISIGDVVKARLSELAMEKTALEGMIMGH